ncbi:PREDICTED: uncharacterized protein At4g04775-like [Camelina sativa]|uniref:Uncharacterized protein At4g04775-like n=1 Tax=Camelina sativa TaxID=90675 RepID=A0ABM1QL63_CAMSA|nr:PREDICTED: uncharacterized protein At4g04775-like [Camelina sativa]
MSNVSGSSSCSKNVRERGRVVGVPKRCWCGEAVVAKTSKSDHNPNRRYFRCVYAAGNKLMNDNHLFKWIDEALLDEVETMKEFLSETMKVEKKMQMELEKKMEMELEKEIFERIEDVKAEFKTRMNRMIIVLVVGCLIICGLVKLI